jgi:hypothetical protein
MHYPIMSDTLKNISSIAFYLTFAMRRNDFAANKERCNLPIIFLGWL